MTDKPSRRQTVAHRATILENRRFLIRSRTGETGAAKKSGQPAAQLCLALLVRRYVNLPEPLSRLRANNDQLDRLTRFCDKRCKERLLHRDRRPHKTRRVNLLRTQSTVRTTCPPRRRPRHVVQLATLVSGCNCSVRLTTGRMGKTRFGRCFRDTARTRSRRHHRTDNQKGCHPGCNDHGEHVAPHTSRPFHYYGTSGRRSRTVPLISHYVKSRQFAKPVKGISTRRLGSPRPSASRSANSAE